MHSYVPPTTACWRLINVEWPSYHLLNIFHCCLTICAPVKWHKIDLLFYWFIVFYWVVLPSIVKLFGAHLWFYVHLDSWPRTSSPKSTMSGCLLSALVFHITVRIIWFENCVKCRTDETLLSENVTVNAECLSCERQVSLGVNVF